MKLLYTNHKDILYEFRLLEDARIVEITKGGVFTYTIRWSSAFLRCDCPGGTYHHKCWHMRMVAPLKKQPTITAPWASWAEEAGREMYDVH